MTTPADDRPPMVRAMEWVSRITTIAFEMVVPGVIGLGLDRYVDTSPLFMILGFSIGLIDSRDGESELPEEGSDE